MSASSPLVTFVVVDFKMLQFCRLLLQSFVDQKLPFEYEFIFIDNGSADGSPEMVRSQFPWAQVVALPKNIGLGPAWNHALAKARGKYVLLLNPDLTIMPGELEKWVGWMETHPDVGVSGPRILNPDGTDQDSCFHFHSPATVLYRRTALGRLGFAKRSMEKFTMRGLDRTVEQDVDWLLGAALLIRREVFDRVGFFDERFFLYFEDTDICRRTWKAGFRVTYTPVATLMHYYGRKSRTKHVWDALFNPIARIHIKSGVHYFWKYRGQPNPRVAR